MDDLPTLNALIEHLKRLPSVGQKVLSVWHKLFNI